MKEELIRLIDVAKDATGIGIGYLKDGELRIIRSRKFDHVMVKACIINILHRRYKLGVLKIARLIGMDHTTVIHHRDGHLTRYEYEPEYKKTYDIIIKEAKLNTTYDINVDEVVQMIREIV